MSGLLVALVVAAGPRPWVPGDACVLSRPLKIEAPGRPKPLPKGASLTIVSIDRRGLAVVKSAESSGRVRLTTLIRQCTRKAATPATASRLPPPPATGGPAPLAPSQWGDEPPLPSSLLPVPGDMPPLPSELPPLPPDAAGSDLPPLIPPTSTNTGAADDLPPLLPPPPDERPGWPGTPGVSTSSGGALGDRKVLALSVGGAGVAALGAAAAFYVVGGQMVSGLEKDINAFNAAVQAGTATAAQDRSIKDRKHKLALYDGLSVAAGLAGLAAVGVGTALWLMAPDTPRTSVGVGALPSTHGGGFVLVSGSF